MTLAHLSPERAWAAGTIGTTMGLQQFERRLERLVEGIFARAFRSGLQPVEIGRRLTREMDLHRQMAPRGTLTPNRFLVSLSPEDRERFEPIEDELVAELESVATDHAHSESYSFLGPVEVELETDDDLSPGMLVLTGEMVASQPARDRRRRSPESDFDNGVERGRPASREAGERDRSPAGSRSPSPAGPAGGPAGPRGPSPAGPAAARGPSPAGPAGARGPSPAGAAGPPGPAGAGARPARAGIPPPPPASRRERARYPEPADEQTDSAPAAPPAPRGPRARADATLVLPDGRRLVIGARGLVIGRQPDCDLVLADPNVSRRHAEIRHAGGGEFEVTDLGSTNGTKVNGTRVRGFEPLQDGDRLTVGATTLQYEQG
jgi:hypothetical protein